MTDGTAHRAARVLAKYLLLQIPGWLMAGAVVVILHRWDVLSVSAGVLVVLLWVAKDLLLFPVVRTAYEGGAPQGADRLIGLAGFTTTRLAPEGYVRLRGELWRAELTDPSQRVEQGATVRVCASRGLTLFVEPAATAHDREALLSRSSPAWLRASADPTFEAGTPR